METKVQELEKASEQTNSENSQLRAKVEKMTTELNEYKKRLSLANNSIRPAATNPRGQVFGSNLVNNLNDVNFQFEFPKFGVLPGPPQKAGNINGRTPSFPSPANSFSTQPTPSSDRADDKATPSSTKSPENFESDREALAKFASIINGNPNLEGFYNNASRTSLDSTNFSLAGTNSGSPSASSNSNAGGPSSSCGTSPEPFTQSPVGFKPVDTLTTIGEEQPNHTAGATDGHFDFGNFDANNFDWLAQQNGGQFDPQLFGGYREPQDNILANTTFDDTFFNEAFDADFTTPFNMPLSPKVAPKKNICTEIDERKEEEDTIVTSVNGKLLTCNNIWYVVTSHLRRAEQLLTVNPGNVFKVAPRSRLVTSTWTAFARIFRRRPSVAALVLSWMKRISERSCPNTLALAQMRQTRHRRVATKTSMQGFEVSDIKERRF